MAVAQSVQLKHSAVKTLMSEDYWEAVKFCHKKSINQVMNCACSIKDKFPSHIEKLNHLCPTWHEKNTCGRFKLDVVGNLKRFEDALSHVMHACISLKQEKLAKDSGRSLLMPTSSHQRVEIRVVVTRTCYQAIVTCTCGGFARIYICKVTEVQITITVYTREQQQEKLL